MDGLVSRSAGMRLRAVQKDRRTASFVASTDALDSYDEKVEQVWNLDRFNANPVILYAHQQRELPIGKAVKCGVVNGQLECDIQFASEKANPQAELVWQSILEETLRAVSVGFYPRSVRLEVCCDKCGAKLAAQPLSGDVMCGSCGKQTAGMDVCVLSDNELMEISVVPVPANPEALAKMRARAVRAPNDQPPATKTETTMSDDKKQLVEFERENAQQAADIKRLEKDLDAANTKLEAVRGELAKTAGERDQAQKDLGEARDKALEQEVDALVNKKITAAEKASFVKLAKTDRALFDEMLAQRADMKLGEHTTAPTEANKPKSADKNDVSDLEAKLAKA